jgi:hypothetical protein
MNRKCEAALVCMLSRPGRDRRRGRVSSRASQAPEKWDPASAAMIATNCQVKSRR